jgi:hypothetical protein
LMTVRALPEIASAHRATVLIAGVSSAAAPDAWHRQKLLCVKWGGHAGSGRRSSDGHECAGSYEVIPGSGGSGWSTVLEKDTVWRSICVWGQTTPRIHGARSVMRIG